jgi:hypothetical protein
VAQHLAAAVADPLGFLRLSGSFGIFDLGAEGESGRAARGAGLRGNQALTMML